MADHSAARQLEWQQLMLRESRMKSALVEHVTIDGVVCSIEIEVGDGGSAIKKHAIKEAVRLVRAKAFVVPAITFKLAASDQIENVAFMAGSGGGRKATIFLGGKYWSGGKAAGREGVASQMYDGTQRWFGNPKQKAQGVAIVVHEIGHILHEINAPDLFWPNKMLRAGAIGNPGPNVWGGAAVKVSAYAAMGQMTCLEFVGEAFAGAVMGKNYDDEVQRAYVACGGATTPRFWRN